MCLQEDKQLPSRANSGPWVATTKVCSSFNFPFRDPGCQRVPSYPYLVGRMKPWRLPGSLALSWA